MARGGRERIRHSAKLRARVDLTPTRINNNNIYYYSGCVCNNRKPRDKERRYVRGRSDREERTEKNQKEKIGGKKGGGECEMEEKKVAFNILSTDAGREMMWQVGCPQRV